MSSLNFWQAQLLALVSMTNKWGAGSGQLHDSSSWANSSTSWFCSDPCHHHRADLHCKPPQCHLHNHGLYLLLRLPLCFLFSGLRRILLHGGILQNTLWFLPLSIFLPNASLLSFQYLHPCTYTYNIHHRDHLRYLEPPTFPSDLASSLFPKDGLHLLGRTWKFHLTNPIEMKYSPKVINLN